MLWNFIRFDFGKSYFRDVTVIELIKEKLPVSISLGLWMTLITYLISIPLGVRKAVQDGSRFDTWTSGIIIIGYAIPGFLFAILLIILFAGGSFFDWFPLRGLTSENWSQLPWYGKIVDYFWHLTLPMAAMVLGAFATLTLLTKNSFLDEIRKQYVLTAQGQGLQQSPGALRARLPQRDADRDRGLSRHLHSRLLSRARCCSRPSSRSTGSACSSFESILNRDYPVVFASLYIFALVGLVVNLASDLVYTWVDPRIDFETREV